MRSFSRSVFFFASSFFLASRARSFSSRAFLSSGIGKNLTALLIEQGASGAQLRQAYNTRKINVLVVAGHDDEVPGAVWRGMRESELNRMLADRLFQLFYADPHFRVSRSRTARGYTMDFQALFETDEGRGQIDAFRSRAAQLMRQAFRAGEVAKRTNVHHPAASNDTAQKLYGINKWANENNIDLVLHVHFNDYPGRPAGAAGKYTGFSIYVPESQLPNAKASRDIAESLLETLATIAPPSSMPQEQGGIVADQDLIAIGANASLKSAVALVEYGYIYEPQFGQPELRDAVLGELAFQTFRGVKKFFAPDYNGPAGGFGTTILPYRWEHALERGTQQKKDIFALQLALSKAGLYPPVGQMRAHCPINGNYGPCTAAAVAVFQEQNRRVLPVASVGTGVADTATLQALGMVYGR